MEQKRQKLDFEEAKRQSLSHFLERELNLGPGKKMAGWLRYNTCPNCGPSKNHRSVRLAINASTDAGFYCHVCGAGGSIIDAAMMIWKCDEYDAVAKLTGVSDTQYQRAEYRQPVDVDDAEVKRINEVRRVAFIRLQAATKAFQDEPACLSYLTEKRMIPLKTVREAQARGMVGFMPDDPKAATELMVEAIGVSALRETGLWKPEKAVPGVAFRPLVFFMPGMSSAEFRVIKDVRPDWKKSITYGTKEYPYWWLGTDRQCMLAEGLIDVMSAVALGFKGHIMGLPGCNNLKEEWLLKAYETHDISRFVIGLDNDVDDPKNPGQRAAKKIAEILDGMGIPNCIHAPPAGDINDILRARHKHATEVKDV